MTTPSGHSKCPYSIGAEFDPLHGEQLEDPYPFYARARREEPVFFSPLLQAWYVTRYDDVRLVLNDRVRFASGDPVGSPFDYLPNTDTKSRTNVSSETRTSGARPPADGLVPLERISQTWVRRTINNAFNSGQIANLDARVTEIAQTLLAAFAPRGHAEFVSEFSFPFAMRVILDVLGVPLPDPAALALWSHDWAETVSTAPDAESDALARLVQSQNAWLSAIEERRTRPRSDLLTCLVAASDQQDPPGTVEQVLNACRVIALSGYETTANLLSMCLFRLLSDPDQMRLICQDRANLRQAVEETLRTETPVQALMRTTTEAVEIGDVLIPAGARVAVCFGSANRDERYFDDAERFDLRHDNSAMHLAFGEGLHHCLGAPLARLEARVALDLIIDSLPGLRLASGKVAFAATPVYRAVRELPIEWPAPSIITPEEIARHAENTSALRRIGRRRGRRRHS